MIENIPAVLRKTQLFAGLTEDEIRALARRTAKKRLQRGELLFGEGDPCGGLFLVASGKIRIYKLSASGREQVLAIEGPGSSFAELLFISRKDFQNFCREHPDVALKVIAVVGARLRRLVGIIEELSFTTVRQRLIALVLQLAEREGKRSKEGIHLELKKSHQDFAAELGTVRELVSRNLSRLQAEGYLEVEGRKLVVKDLAALKRELSSPE